MSDYGLSFGLPPFAPLARAAAALASLVTEPPRRPKATAAGFLAAFGTVAPRNELKRGPAVGERISLGLHPLGQRGVILARLQ